MKLRKTTRILKARRESFDNDIEAGRRGRKKPGSMNGRKT